MYRKMKTIKLNFFSCELLSYSVPLVLHNNQGDISAPNSCCELLSYSVPLVLHNNTDNVRHRHDCVVNCFHIQYLWYYTTTWGVPATLFDPL